ncbi:MAG TPA: CCA tRNA nucleotidyltransferase [Roseimicrobium sp.]|nr:CCA tRNA nucleotidyltransferase [Roseimicrobium sp.]
MTLRDIAADIVRRLQTAGYEAFWVGGCVRDQLLDRVPHDYDIATDATPTEIEALFPHTIPVGRQFGVIIAVIEGMQFQIATFREESGYQDGRRPDRVRFTNAQADAFRRAFTENGVFYDPTTDTLHDWVGGKADLAAKVIRTIGNPGDRFREDHLRLLRAIRFAAQLGFEVEERTLDSVRANCELLKSVSAERVRDELLKLFMSPHAARGFVLLKNSGLMEVVLPEMTRFTGCEQPPDHHPEGDVFEHVRRMLDLLPCEASTELVWSVLLHDIAKPLTFSRNPETGRIRFYEHEKVGADLAEEILTRLRFPKQQTAAIKACVRHHMQFISVPQMRRSTLRKLFLHPTFDTELDLLRLDSLGSSGDLALYNQVRSELEAFNAMPQLVQPLVSGDDLMALGIPAGPELGKLLSQLRELQLQGELQTRDESIMWVRQRFHS